MKLVKMFSLFKRSLLCILILSVCLLFVSCTAESEQTQSLAESTQVTQNTVTESVTQSKSQTQSQTVETTEVASETNETTATDETQKATTKNSTTAKKSTTKKTTTKTTKKSTTTEKTTAQVTQSDMYSVKITVSSQTFTAKLYKNDATEKLISKLPLTIDMDELNGNEKYYYLDFTLKTDTEKVGSIKAGDIMLYGNDCLVLFYESFDTSYSYTRLGYVEDATEFAKALGDSGVSVTIEEA